MPMTLRRHIAPGLTAAVLTTILATGCAGIATLTEPSRLALTEHPLVNAIARSDGKRADEAAVLAAMRRADVIILGETHDNPEHHAIQARLLTELTKSGRRPAVVFEQIDRTRQDDLDRAQRLPAGSARIEAIGATFAKGWDWPAYRPLVEIAVDAQLPIRGGNVDRSALRPLVKEGWETIAEGIRNHLAIDAAWNPERDAYLTKVIDETHCNAIDNALRDGLVRAQRLRDATIADAVLSARGYESRPVVLITGRGHARSDAGVPRYVAAREPALRVVSIGISEVEAGAATFAPYLKDRADGVPHDFLWLTARFDRPDPCAAFGR